MPIISTELQRAAYVARCLQLSAKSTGFQRLPAEVDLFGIVFSLRGRSHVPYPPPHTPGLKLAAACDGIHCSIAGGYKMTVEKLKHKLELTF